MMPALLGSRAMPSRFVVRGFFLFAVSLLTCLPMAYAGEPQWVEVHSPHFSVVTDAGEKRGQEVAVRFEQMRAVFGTLLVKSNVNLPVPLQIVAFRNTKELRQFSPLWKGKPTSLAGLFLGNSDRSFILLDLSVENPWQVVFHEYGHQLLDGNITGRIDPWFDEGFAEYFSSIEVDGKQARVGKIPNDTYIVMHQSGYIKVSDLFRVQHNSSTYNENGDHRSAFYAESSFVVHYLYDTNLIQKLGPYVTLADDRHVAVEEAIQQAFGMSASQFDKALRSYIDSEHYKYNVLPTPAGIITTNYIVTPMSPADSAAVLADVHLHSSDYQAKAMEEFQAILKTNPNNAAALRGLGYSYLQQKDYARAADCFDKAAAANSNDPRVHYYAALLMSHERGRFSPEDLPRMTKELETAVSLDANYADAYSLLAFAYAYGQKPDRGIEMMKKAVSLNPQNEGYIYNLGQLYLNDRKPDQAIAVLSVLRGSPNPQIAAQANDLIRNAQQLKAMASVEPNPGGASRSGGVIEFREPSAADHASEPPSKDPGSNPQIKDIQAQGEAVRSPSTATPAPAAAGVTRFLKGSVVSVDCAQAPAAVVTLSSGTKTVKLRVRDTRQVIVIGADAFSCQWHAGQKLAVNYRESGDGTGDTVSIEVQ
jgi:Tfp pilus assembly protein PilF